MRAYSDKHSDRGDSAEKVPMQPRRWYSSSPPVRVWMSQVTKRGYWASGSVTRSRVLLLLLLMLVVVGVLSMLVAAVLVEREVVVVEADEVPEAREEEEEELAPAPARRARRVRAGIFLGGEDEEASDPFRWVR